MMARSPSDRRIACRSFDIGRVEIGAILLLLLLSLGWIVLYSTILIAPPSAPALSPAMAATLDREHDAELKKLQLQMTEVYGEMVPQACGS